MNAPSQGFEPETGLSDYHRRCLDKRIDECNDALAQAVRALCEAEHREPGDVSLHALCGLLQAAHRLTDLAHHMESERGLTALNRQNRQQVRAKEQPPPAKRRVRR